MIGSTLTDAKPIRKRSNMPHAPYLLQKRNVLIYPGFQGAVLRDLSVTSKARRPAAKKPRLGQKPSTNAYNNRLAGPVSSDLPGRGPSGDVESARLYDILEKTHVDVMLPTYRYDAQPMLVPFGTEIPQRPLTERVGP